MTQPHTGWKTSTYSQTPGGNCVEVRGRRGMFAVRDSKDRTGPTLAFDASDWSWFLTSVK